MDFAFLPLAGNLLAYAERCVEMAQREGAVPTSRAYFTGSELAIVARYAAQDGYLPRGISVFYEAEPGLIWLDLLYVEPDFRRQNIGWQLVERTRSFAVQQRFREIALGTLTSNTPMRSLMAKAPGLFHSTPLRRGAVCFSEQLSRAVR